MSSHAWLFPGQGAQAVGMGKALAEVSPAAREVFQRADEALGFSLSTLCFEGPEADLGLTKFTQPAIVTTSLAALAALREFFPELPQPAFAAGHSLGEYSALVAAGALKLEDAVRVVHLRGTAMQEAVPAGHGGMAAIMGSDKAGVEELCRDAAEGDALGPANFNGPGQIVIAGTAGAIERAAQLAKDRSMKAIILKVSAPFHCALMAPARVRVEEALRAIHIQDPAFPVVANVTAEPVSDAVSVRRLLGEQVDSPVLWEQSVQRMSTAGVRAALEIGPGKVLQGLIKRIDKAWSVQIVGQPADLEAARAFVGAIPAV